MIYGGYLAWLLWGTGLSTARAQDRLRVQFQERLEHPRPAPVSGEEEPEAEAPAHVSFRPGEAVGILRIPDIGLEMVVVEGTGTEDLKKGPGHYVDTAFPWEPTGRVGIAGHRTTYGQPFWSLQELRGGELIELVTEFGTFTYRVTRQLVGPPDASWTLNQTKEPSLVLTTCTPRFSASQRLFVFAVRE